MNDSTASFALPPVTTMEDTERLHTFLLAAQGAAITIDCSAVERLHGLTAQMLVVACNLWRRNAQQVTILNPSTGFQEGVALLGLSDILSAEQVIA